MGGCHDNDLVYDRDCTTCIQTVLKNHDIVHVYCFLDCFSLWEEWESKLGRRMRGFVFELDMFYDCQGYMGSYCSILPV